MNTYYHSGSRNEIKTILRKGFKDTAKHTESSRSGVYLADAPGEPDPEFVDDRLLEITLPEEIDTSRWKLVFPDVPAARWDEWLIPARVLNEHAKVRQLTKEQWERLWAKYNKTYVKRLMQGLKDLVAKGFLEHAKDDQGQPLYRNGEPVWRLTEKRPQQHQ